ncbi:unnamed protein product [Durusdinium trenchii]|uniref:Uncharacterized protein n=1 Tax=Durusdinium trenchii TaxID=1381693 RepID=A0ABP0PLH2_9DINO
MMGADGDQNHGNRENSWLHIKEEIKEEIQQDQIGPLSVATTTAEDEIKQQVKEEVEEKVELGQDSVEPATTPTTKRRRLTRRNMQGKRAATIATETLARASIKKEKPDDDDVLVKQEESDDQDAHALWLQVKKEIKEEMHQEQIGCLGVGTTIAGHEVKQEVKDEVEDKVDAASHPVGLAITPRAKRRRLTRWNMQEKPADTRTVTQVCIKKEKPDDAQVKQEESDGQDTHALWLQVKQAVKEEMQQDQIGCLGVGTEVKEEVEEKVDTRSDPVGPAITSTPPSKKRHLARKETKIKKEKGDDREAPQDQPDESEIKEELGKKDSTADSIKIKEEHIVDASSILPPSKEEGASADDASLDTFAAAAATWAQQCLAFRKTKTWTPTRPCCPANFFVGPVDGMPTAPPEDAPACVQRLSAYRLRCLRRFHLKHDPQTLLAEEVQVESPMRLASPKKDRALSPEELLLAEKDWT